MNIFVSSHVKNGNFWFYDNLFCNVTVELLICSLLILKKNSSINAKNRQVHIQLKNQFYFRVSDCYEHAWTGYNYQIMPLRSWISKLHMWDTEETGVIYKFWPGRLM